MEVQAFRTAVLERHKFTCAVCGTQVRSTLTAAHIRPWTTDLDNRANPANGICLCVYCPVIVLSDHGLVQLGIDGALALTGPLDEEMATAHFMRVQAAVRKSWLSGVDPTFLEWKKKL